uniref:Uncharacterized protein n=1 Tax=Sus scrofa TaxID=9823 RepID=A0A4X1SWU9_PIG
MNNSTQLYTNFLPPQWRDIYVYLIFTYCHPTYILLLPNRTRPNAVASDFIIGLLCFPMCLSLHLPDGFDQIWTFIFISSLIHLTCFASSCSGRKNCSSAMGIDDEDQRTHQKLHQMNDLCMEKKQLDSQLNMLQNQQGNAFQGPRKADTVAREKVTELIQVQAQRILALKEEIALLRKKGGLILPPIHPPQENE